MTELTSEVARLGREAEAATKEQSTYLAYDKRVKELAEDVTSYQVRETYKAEDPKIFCILISGPTG